MRRINMLTGLAFMLLLVGNHLSCVDKKEVVEKTDPAKIWADSIYTTMNLDQKIGQLFHVATYSNREQGHYDTIAKMVEELHLGGLIFFQGGPVRQARLYNHYQSLAKVPLMIGMDLEWGLQMRLDSTAKFAYNMTLGATQDPNLIYEIGRSIGRQCKRLGVHMNYSPVADINTNPKNPIIGVRSFGEDKQAVAVYASAMAKGLQDEGILTSGKHFPGHGDTASDSHYTLPTINFDVERLDSVELFPFRQLMKQDLSGVMVAHLNIPALEPEDGLPSSLSKNVVTDLLRNKLKFEGLVMTDALNMKGVANFDSPGEIDLKAFLAGHDMLLFPEDVEKGVLKIKEAYNKRLFSEERLSASVKRILRAKYRVGLNEFKPIEEQGLIADLNAGDVKVLKEKVASKSITRMILSSVSSVEKGQKEFDLLTFGDGDSKKFVASMTADLQIDLVNNKQADRKTEKPLIISYHRKNSRRVHAIPEGIMGQIEKISTQRPVILCVFASQYSLSGIDAAHLDRIYVAYENMPEFQKAMASVLLGKSRASGSLPASIELN